MAGWAERVAAGFHALGVREGAAVAWQLPTRVETVIASLALWLLGDGAMAARRSDRFVPAL